MLRPVCDRRSLAALFWLMSADTARRACAASSSRKPHSLPARTQRCRHAPNCSLLAWRGSTQLTSLGVVGNCMHYGAFRLALACSLQVQAFSMTEAACAVLAAPAAVHGLLLLRTVLCMLRALPCCQLLNIKMLAGNGDNPLPQFPEPGVDHYHAVPQAQRRPMVQWCAIPHSLRSHAPCQVLGRAEAA